MRRPGLIVVIVGAIAVFAAIAWLAPRDQPARPVSSGQTGATGTGGMFADQQEAEEDTSATEKPSIGEEAVGERVTLHVRAGDLANDVAFWVEAEGRQLLVVTNRDRRSAAQRQRGAPPAHAIAPPAPGEPVVITGTIEPIPTREEMYSWGLTIADRATLADAGVYVRAETIMPAGDRAAGRNER